MSTQKNDQRPNILFLMTDQQQQSTIRQDSACITPNLDSLMQSGTTFSGAHTVNAICSPARASLMTGRLPHNHGMVDNAHCVEPFRADFNPDLNTFSRQLKKHGYQMGYYGKWHVERTSNPGAFGFDDFITEYHGLEFKRTIENPMEISGLGYNNRTVYGVHSESVEETEEYYYYSKGIDFIESHRHEEGNPWCTIISTNAPHDPFIAPREMYDLYDPSQLELPASFTDSLEDKPAIYSRIRSVFKDLNKKDYQELTACYFANCSLVDSQIGRIVKYLEQTGQRENTLIVFLSDHGEMLGGHGLLCKGVPAFEETYAIPMIFNWPGHVPAGEDRQAYVSIIDVAPTILDLSGCDSLEDIDGTSLVSLFDNDDSSEERSIYAEFFGQRLSYSQRIVWKGPYKYIFNGFDFDELYNLEADPAEKVNLIRDKDYEKVAQEMSREMWTWARKTKDDSLLESEYFMYRFAPVGPETRKVASIYNRGA